VGEQGRRLGDAFRVYAAGGLLALAAAGCGGKTPQAPRAQNVLVVTIDTLRWDRVGAFGGPSSLTPHLDRLAARGAVFTSAFSPAPLTLPAHASLFSGRLPFRHGVRVNGTDRVADGVPLLAPAFREAGYATAAVIGSLVLRSEVGLARGFDTYDESFAWNAGRDAAQWRAERGGEEVVDRAIAWLDAHADGRFFLWVHLYDPHAPYAPPPAFRDRFPSPYDGEVAAADAALGRLITHLETRGLLAKTLVAVAGDHGESLGEHGEKTHGVFLYDATLHVPLVVVAPSGVAGARVGTPVSLVDLAPTLREAAQLPEDREGDGVSLWSALAGTAPTGRVVYAESVYPAALLGWSPLKAVRSASFKYVDAPRRELYDLSADPGERANVFRADRADARDLARRLGALLAKPALRAGPPATVDEETVRRLASLGYVTPQGGGSDLDRIDAAKTDPKDRIGDWPAIEDAIIARQLGKSAEAAALLSALDPAVLRSDPALFRELALDLRRCRRARESAAAYEEILRRFPPLPEDWFGLGIAWHLLGRQADAARAHDEAVRLRPDFSDAWINLGQESLALGRLERARDAFQHAVALDGGSVDGLSGLAAVAAERRDFEAAVARLHEALVADPDRAETIENLARVERARGNRNEAKRLLRRLEEIRSRKPAAG
jgi:arylsulfatase A-like enzyme/Flp pilus assembly protein TadD